MPPAADAHALPNLVVIGAAKCGTSSLHYYLGLHPEIQMSSPKELRFFCDRPEIGTAAPAGWWSRGNWERGSDWYASHFSGHAPVRGESTPQYTAPAFPAVAERMSATLPEARLIYLVRNPVDRMLSDHAQRLAEGFESRPAEQALADRPNPYLERTRYHTRLLPFLEHFGARRILVLASEALLRRRRETLRAAFEFLGVDSSFWTPRMERLRNTTRDSGAARRFLGRLPHGRLGHRLTRGLPGEAKWRLERLASTRPRPDRPGAAISRALRAELNDELRDEVIRLRELAGEGFDEWEV